MSGTLPTPPIRLQDMGRISFTLYFQVRIALPCNGIATVRAEGCAGYIRVSEGIQTVQPLLLTRQSYRKVEILNPFIKNEQGKLLIIKLELFHLTTLMHNSLFINNMYTALLSSTCFEH